MEWPEERYRPPREPHEKPLDPTFEPYSSDRRSEVSKIGARPRAAKADEKKRACHESCLSQSSLSLFKPIATTKFADETGRERWEKR